jgi:hypothetical protein
MRYLHFPPLPTQRWLRDCKNDHSAYIEELKCRGILHSEIMKRYIPAPFPPRVKAENWSWIPDFDEIIETSHQKLLLNRIWDGRQTLAIDETECEKDARFIYWIDFDNQVVEVKGMVGWSQDSVTVPFAEMEFRKLQSNVRRLWWSEHQEELEKATAELDTVD